MADNLTPASHTLSLTEIAEYHEDTVASLKVYFNEAFSLERFIGYTPDQRSEELHLRIDETALRSMFITLASIEANFRLDDEFRCRNKLQDNLPRSFRKIYKVRKERVALDEDIFEAWRMHIGVSGTLISELRTTFRLRHWIAHGRYWHPKLGRTFDSYSVYDLASAVIQQLSESVS